MREYKLRNYTTLDAKIDYSNEIKKFPNNLSESKKLQQETKNKLNRLKGIYINESTNYRACITSETIGKILRPAPKINEVSISYYLNLLVSQQLDSLFKKAIYVDTLLPMKRNNPNEIGYHHFVVPIAINNLQYKVMITAREKKNSNILYVVKVNVVSDINLSKVVQINDIYQISVRDLIDDVSIYNYNLHSYIKYDHTDYLSENNLEYGYCI